MNEHFVTNAGMARRLSITDEQQLAALEAARLERKAIRLRRAEIEQRREYVRAELRDLGVVFLDEDPAYARARPGRLGSRKGDLKKWTREYGRLVSRLARVEERAELERRRIAHLMHAAPGASASHRGTKSTYNTAARDAVRREPDAPRERITDGKRHPVKVARVSDSGRMRP
jgi:hypothetical protein